MDGTKEEHEVTAECLPHHCFIHQKDEPTEGKPFYRLCGECYHCFYTEEELIEAYKADQREGITFTCTTQGISEEKRKEALEALEAFLATITVDQIHDCPHCDHSF